MNSLIKRYLSLPYEKKLYLLGLCVIFSSSIFCAILSLFHINLWDILPSCSFYSVVGVYCPGCGATRSLHFLFDGQFFKSIYFHPFIPYIFILFVFFMISHTLELVTKKKIHGMPLRPLYLYIGIIIIFFQYFVKLAFLFIFGKHLI